MGNYIEPRLWLSEAKSLPVGHDTKIVHRGCGLLAAAEALAAVELAAQADAARKQSVELGIQKGHTVDRAIGVAAKANKIESLFKLDE